MNFDHGTGLVDGLLTIDTTTPAPHGTFTNSLEILGTGSVILPAGTTAERPGTPVASMFRFNSTDGVVEFYNGTTWIQSTAVTSVGLAAPSIFNVTGSPVTTTGTLTLNLATQTAHSVWAGPTSGGDATPTFRSLVFDDLPIQLYRENPLSPTTPVASGSNAIALGSGSSATATGAMAFGNGAAARVYGQTATANGSFASLGDAQQGVYIFRNITTDATQTELFLDGTTATQRFVLANNSAVTFSILIVARRTDATGGGAGYRVEGVIRKDASAASTTIIGAVTKSVLGETDVPWDISVDADTTNGTLRIRVTGEAAKTIRWVATVTTAEVTD